MGEREPFNPRNPFNMAVEAVRMGALQGISEARMPQRASRDEVAMAYPMGAAMAFICTVIASAAPGQHNLLLNEIVEQFPEMVALAETIRREGTSNG